MHSILCDVGLVGHVIRRMSLAEATQFAASCRTAAQEARTFQAAIAFGCTRPGAYGSNDFDVQMWEQMWKSCAQSVAACGLEPSAWAWSTRFCYWDRWRADYMLENRRLDCFRFLSSLVEMAGGNLVKLVQRPCDIVNADASAEIDETANARISAILMVAAYHEDTGLPCYELKEVRDRGSALVCLSNGQLAFIVWFTEEFDGLDMFDVDAGATVYMEKNLPALFDLMTSELGPDCHWTLKYGGALSLACDMECHFISQEDWLGFPNPTHYWKDTGLTANDDRRDRLKTILRSSFRRELTIEQVIQETARHLDPPATRDEVLLALQANRLEDEKYHVDPPALCDEGLLALHANWLEGEVYHV